ncbi:MAG TPA: TetR/AcrR family transcriptional regulator, partial [Paraburkholderia sp.]|nr:TetR/AcrR family transcriptional regulator [Paraburkholderia sp.]
PDASQLAVFASVLGDAGSADIACDAVRQTQPDRTTLDAARSADTPELPSTPPPLQASQDAAHRTGEGSLADRPHTERQAETRDDGPRFATHGG